ncbi:NAD-dependent epimerase/dehydratase family protein [Actinomadura rayongensis]|uniref:NAD-dependent epimerase/dehydratase family protein n=1 Tax=Actinomadura rayongensis TaxID=1429076 RepID=A0A6I4WB65_9ACTN|nr:NAD-dependent epimerase/dehydratase family protein [Actinomadura rayongensis]MXQ66791.1 NAD-dependent epimerase/dehydratase family protein [Actinomadura rayongensis]
MRIVVVGATGNVGVGTLRALAADAEVTSVLGIARRRPEVSFAKTEWAAADTARDDLVPLFRDADAVINLAWMFQPTHRPRVTWRNNVLGGMRVLRAVADADVPALVHASSVGAYSPKPADGRPVDESWPTDGWPTAAYSREKCYLERVLDAFELANPERRVVRMRPGFIFQRGAATAQRRIFGGPFVPNRLARAGVVPVLPDIPGLAVQALHADDAGEAYRLAAVRDVRGAFNLAADPVIDMQRLADLLSARTARVPVGALRAFVAGAWRLGIVPASPDLFDLALHVPLLDTGRAHEELGWRPRHSSLDAIAEFLDGLRSNASLDTPPLARSTSGPMRIREFATGIGRRP